VNVQLFVTPAGVFHQNLAEICGPKAVLVANQILLIHDYFRVLGHNERVFLTIELANRVLDCLHMLYYIYRLQNSVQQEHPAILMYRIFLYNFFQPHSGVVRLGLKRCLENY
jgi:hypothetical protein